MPDNTVLDKIREIVADVTHTSIEDVYEETSSQNLTAWDSVAQINIIVGIESEFGIEFSVEEMYSLTSIQKIRTRLELSRMPDPLRL